MKSLLSLIAGLVFAVAVPADAARSTVDAAAGAAALVQDPDHGAGDAHQQGEQGAHGGPTMEMGNAEFFVSKYEHLEPHLLVDLGVFGFYDVNLYQLIAVALMVVVFGAVLVSFRSNRVPWILRVFRGWCHWLRDEVVIAVMGDDEGRRFAPYFIYLFFFIAFANLLGMIPNAVTATATVFVTGALAALTFVMMVVGGMMKQGVGAYWKSLVPHGLPLPLVPLLFVLEIIGLLVKPFALTIRLFANMLAGHLVIYSFVAMIFLFAKLLEMSAVSYLPAAFAVGMGVFISIIEAFVALLQAYIFTFLSVVFVRQSLHPAH